MSSYVTSRLVNNTIKRGVGLFNVVYNFVLYVNVDYAFCGKIKHISYLCFQFLDNYLPTLYLQSDNVCTNCKCF